MPIRHIIPISGKDSCATAVAQLARSPTLPYELFFTDVGAELPETYEWLHKAESYFQRPVHRVGASLEEIIRHHQILPSMNVRFCTREGKIEPMERYVGRDEAILYIGIREDEDRGGYINKGGKTNIKPCYPLKEMGIGLPQVYQILDKIDLMPPRFHWESLYRSVLAALEREEALGFRSKEEKSPSEKLRDLPRWLFDQLFCWRSRSNCFFCFFQQPWEWVGLLEHHPLLFDKAEEIETTVGSGGRREEGKVYTWAAGRPLAHIRRDKAVIQKRRIVRVLQKLRKERSTSPRRKRIELDLMQLTSCGLFCGK